MQVCKPKSIFFFLFLLPLYCLSQNVTFIFQSQLDTFDPETTYINGDLSIGYPLINNDITDLTNLSNLIYITGSLNIAGNTELANVAGLFRLMSITGDLNISYNPKLRNLLGLSSLVSIARDLNITSNVSLTDCCGIKHLLLSQGAIGRNVIIDYNPSECSNEQEIINSDCSGPVFLTSQNEVDAFDPEITELTKGLFIGTFEGTTDIVDLSNLSNITTISNYLIIGRNGVLQSVDDFSNLTSIDGFLFIRYNDALTNVDGFSSLTSISGNMDIKDNSNLIDCCGIQHLLLSADAIGGINSIYNNPSECSSQKEILDADCITSTEDFYDLNTYITFQDFSDRILFSINEKELLPVSWQLVNAHGVSMQIGILRSIEKTVIRKDEMLPGIYFFSAEIKGETYTWKIAKVN